MNKQIEMIDRVLNELQSNIARRAVEFFKYGWVIFAGCLTHYLLSLLGLHGWIKFVWMIVPVLCVLLGVMSGSRKSNHSNISTSEKLLGAVWGIVGLVMIYLSLVAPGLGFFPASMGLPIVLILFFILVAMTGITINHLPTIGLSSAFFLGSIAASAMGEAYHLPILTIVILLGFILPSYLIKAKFL